MNGDVKLERRCAASYRSRIMTRNLLILGSLTFVAALTPLADAAPSRAPRPASAPRGKEAGARVVGTHVVPHPERPMHPANNPPHTVVIHNTHTNKDENH